MLLELNAVATCCGGVTGMNFHSTCIKVLEQVLIKFKNKVEVGEDIFESLTDYQGASFVINGQALCVLIWTNDGYVSVNHLKDSIESVRLRA
jgi:hypothetical protein